MTRTSAQAALAGIAGVLMFSLTIYLPVLGALIALFSPLPLLYVGLRFGVQAALIAAASGLVFAALVFPLVFLGPIALQDLIPGLVVVFLALRPQSRIPSLVVVSDQVTKTDLKRRLSLMWYPPGSIAAWLSAGSLGLLMVFGALLANSAEGLEGTVDGYFNAQLTAAMGSLPPDAAQQAAGLTIAYLPGVILATWVVRVCVCAVLAQRLLGRKGVQRRPSPVYSDLDLPVWFLGLFGVFTILWLLLDGDSGYLAGCALVVLGVPVGFMGLVLVHRAVRALAALAPFVLGVFYVFLGLAIGEGLSGGAWSGWAALLFAGLAEWVFRRIRPDEPTSGQILG